MASVLNHPNCAYFGYYSSHLRLDLPESIEEIDDVDTKAWNVSIAINWIPVVGNLLAGYSHYNYGEEGSLIRARGIAEMTIVGGLILAVVDLLITLGRLIQSHFFSLESDSELSS